MSNVIALASLISQLSALFPERSGVIRALVAAIVAREHACLIGPPGTAKSLLVRTLASSCGLSSWETLMTRFTPPEEVLGPVRLSGLQQDRFTRAHAGYLPSAEIAFLDEVFKANSAILNALLSALNERIVHDDGKPVPIPLVSCIGASNELPEGPELGALYDRFLVRATVDYVSDRDSWKAMLTMGAPKVIGSVDIRAEQAAADAVALTDDTIEALANLRDACRKAGLSVSDRRWRQTLSLVRAWAHLDGRKVSDPEDLECLDFVLWSKPDERAQVSKLVASVVSPSGAKATEELDMAREIEKKIPPKGSDPTVYLGAIGTAIRDLKEIAMRTNSLPDKKGKRVVTAIAEIKAVQDRVAKLALEAAGVSL